ncbi:phosphonate metabolism protein/1,5-bisphosphokinase (PRPP-forming) PhnN [Acidisoma sp. 7E03]
MTGLLVLVVGPSGSGKDTLLAGAATALRGDPRFVFARRTVTREASHEDHETVDVPTFLSLLREGQFGLHWEAHGLYYGVPNEGLAAATAGAIVVVNVSRSVIAEAARRFSVVAVEITAPDALRAARLAERGRESGADIARRLSRQAEPPPGVALHRISNDGTIAAGVSALVGLLTHLAEKREGALTAPPPDIRPPSPPG